MIRHAIDLSRPGGLLIALLPELVLTVWTLVLLLVAAWRHRDPADQRQHAPLALVALVSTLLVVLSLWALDVRPSGIPAMMALDDFRWAVDTVFLVGAILAVLLSPAYLDRERIVVPEYYALVLFAVLGMMLMGGGVDLIVVFLGLELMSIAVYVLSGINRRSPFAAEASLKYFLLGAFASGFFLYGIALVYGATGTTNLTLVYVQVAILGLGTHVLITVGAALLLIGFGFKVAAVPFHMWAPDVYDGAPTPVTAFMAAAVKAAGFAALVRVLFAGLAPAEPAWGAIVWWLAVITIVVGNLVALAQRRVKRMLAYSSVAHAGYLLAAVAAGSELGTAALLFYVLAYTLMTVGAFAVVAAAGRDGERDLSFDDLNGLARRRPWIAFAMTVCMLSLLGFPGTAGFIGKWYIFAALADVGESLLAVVLAVGSVVSAGYYLPVVMAMYMKPAAAADAHAGTRLAGGGRWVLAATTALILLFGVWPNRLLDLARRGVDDFQPRVVVSDAGLNGRGEAGSGERTASEQPLPAPPFPLHATPPGAVAHP